jgi:DNA primase
MSKIDDVKSRLDIVDVVSDYVELRKSGRNFSAFCPFHADSRTASFVVFPETQRWHCFGACGEGGDVFNFIMKRENLPFGDALRLLARRAGVELEPFTPEQKRSADQRERLHAIMTAAAAFYHDQLLHLPAAEEARAYLQRRALTTETASRFQVGYAPDQWEALKGHLLSRGHTLSDLVAAGVIVERQDGTGHYDRFRHRLIIPICLPTVGRGQRGQVVGFGGRVLRDEDVPKYLNSPQTPLFDKSAILYGLDMARETIRRWDQAVIVEGYMDVLQAHQHGFTNVVASMGTALTEDQLRSLTRLTDKLVLALDADAAGAQATLRGLDVAQRALDREMAPVITPQGLVRYEGRLQIALRISILPQGKDPDDVIRADPDQWKALVEGALPVLDYYVQALTADLDLTDPKDKAQAVERLAPVLNEIANEVERAHYLQQLARMVRVDERVLARQIAAARAPRRRPPALRGEDSQPSATPSQGSFHFGAEEHCLASVERHASLLGWVDAQLAEMGMPVLAPSDFSRVENQQLFRAVRRAGGAEGLREALDPLLHDYLDWLLEAATSHDDRLTDKLKTDILATALRLRQNSLHTRVTQLHFLQLDAQAEGRQDVITGTGETVDQLEEELREVQRAFSRCFSLGRQRLEHVMNG